MTLITLQMMKTFPGQQYFPQAQAGHHLYFDTYRSATLKLIQDQLSRPKKTFKKNLKKKEFQALRTLQNNCDITIRPADKGGSIVIRDTSKYIEEYLRQVIKKVHHEELDRDPA